MQKEKSWKREKRRVNEAAQQTSATSGELSAQAEYLNMMTAQFEL